MWVSPEPQWRPGRIGQREAALNLQPCNCLSRVDPKLGVTMTHQPELMDLPANAAGQQTTFSTKKQVTELHLLVLY